jgi:putative nucleotidyltransferase with HDIG domain
VSAKDIKKYIAEMNDLATIPVLLAKIVRTCNDPNAGPRDIINLVTYDPALAERILRIANSVFFGHSGQIKNLYQAVMLLGLERIKALALGLTVLNALPARGSSIATHIWMHSYEVAFVASSIARYMTGLLSGDCFLAGLLHDVGRIVFLGMDPERFRRLEAADNLMDQEIAVFGCTHTEAGALLIEKIGIPRELAAPIQYHHAPLRAEESRDLVAAVALAEALIGLRKSRPEEDGVWNKDHDVLVKQFTIAAPALDAVYDDLVNARGEIEGIFTLA